MDNARIPYGRMKMCHMVADSLDELNDMADAIGVSRRWLQMPPKASFPHYDVCASKRKHAIERGAVEATRKQLIEAARRCREACSRWSGVRRIDSEG